MSEGGFKNAAMKRRPEGANENMRDKVKPNGIREGGSQFGTTIEHSKPARFPNTGASQKKKGSGVPEVIEGSPHGTTFLANSPAVDFPDRLAKDRRNKTESKSEPKFDPYRTKGAQDKTASQKSGEGEAKDRPYPLKKDYEKSGKSDKKSHKIY